MKNEIYRVKEHGDLILYERAHYLQFPPLTKYYVIADHFYRDCRTRREAIKLFDSLKRQAG